MGSRDPKGDREKRRRKTPEPPKGPPVSPHKGKQALGAKMHAAANKPKSSKSTDNAASAPAKKSSPTGKPNGKGGESFGKAFARERAAQGPGGKFDWEDPKTGKTDSFHTRRADDKPTNDKPKKGNGLAAVGAALKDAVKDIGAPTPEATKKTARKYQSSAPGPAGSVGRKRGARQRSKMKSELRASKATPKKATPKKAAATKDVDAKAAAKAAPKQAALDSKSGNKGKVTGMKKLPLAPDDRGRLKRAPVKEEPKKKRNPGAKGKQARGAKMYASGGKVRGVGAAKRGFGRGKTV